MKHLQLLALLILSISCGSNGPKSIKDEYSGPWTEFWDSFDMKNKEGLAIIQTMNDNRLPDFEYHYFKASTETDGKYLVALKKENSTNWEFYFVWPRIGKLEGPFKNDANIDLPNTKKSNIK